MLQYINNPFKSTVHKKERGIIIKNLSPRELQVLKSIINGSTNETIAKSLYVSLATVKAHVSSIFRKLETTNRVRAAVIGVEILKELEQQQQ